MSLWLLIIAKALVPFLALSGAGLVLLLFAAFLPRQKGVLFFAPTLVAIVGTFVLAWQAWLSGFPLESGMVLSDKIAYAFDLVFLIATFLALLLSRETEEGSRQGGEYYVLILFATAGMILMAHSGDLLLLFIALEIMSIAAYILAGYSRTLKSSESSMKYFILGAFASGFLLYGIALIYGATGTTDFRMIAEGVNPSQGTSPDPWLIRLGIALLLIGLGFKVAAVPFHFWTPDVYEGAPTPITALMASGVKAAGFIGLVRLAIAFAPYPQIPWTTVISALAILTMTVGNLVALKQSNIKRMLAYSSIAHAGYALVGLAACLNNGLIREEALASVFFYMVAYSLMTIGAFAVVVAVGRKKGDVQSETVEEIGDYAGLSESHPLLAAVMALFMIALTGIPPTIGFIGKFYLLRAAVESGLIGLVVMAVLNSVVSAFYYLGVVSVIYFRKEQGCFTQGESVAPISTPLLIALGLTGVAVAYLGLFPEELFALARQSFQAAVF
ncbi:MAG: NADH-quinone oxidoreductase subunit N [Deltaproteobacteria bacterium]|nr:NADH-quinone oxidoreductase subunit N [Deltaproteobacteria bacterium]